MRIIKDDMGDGGKVGYVRVSSAEQNEGRQVEAFLGLGLGRIFVDKVSAKEERPMLAAMFEYVREGDVVYVKDFSRLARGTRDLLDIVEELCGRGVKLVSMKENFDTQSAVGRLMITLVGAVYEFERECILERQREGIALARKENRYRGRKKIPRPAEWDEVFGLYQVRRMSAKEAMGRLGLKRNTFYRFVAENRRMASETRSTSDSCR